MNGRQLQRRMLEHEQCYLKWPDQLWEAYPDLVIEKSGKEL